MQASTLEFDSETSDIVVVVEYITRKPRYSNSVNTSMTMNRKASTFIIHSGVNLSYQFRHLDVSKCNQLGQSDLHHSELIHKSFEEQEMPNDRQNNTVVTGTRTAGMQVTTR